MYQGGDANEHSHRASGRWDYQLGLVSGGGRSYMRREFNITWLRSRSRSSYRDVRSFIGHAPPLSRFDASRRAASLRTRDRRGIAVVCLAARPPKDRIGFIPYFAAAIVVPALAKCCLRSSGQGRGRIWTRRAPIKAVLNVSAHAIMESVASPLYTVLGGVALAQYSNIAELYARNPCCRWLPALVAFVGASLVE